MSYSLLKYKSHVENGDTVIVYMGKGRKVALQIKRGEIFNTNFGPFPHNHLIGQKYGSKVFSKTKKGWIYMLFATPELWTVTLPHRTQILYNADISMTLLQLNLRPGSIVVESGTGSGSMSHAILRTIAPCGHLYTFEFHEMRATMARDEFERHGLSDMVTVTHKNVLENGFGLSNVADAVFLDLPSPWDAIKFSKEALKTNGGHLCSFSPCIEQVQQTCIVLEENGFRDIRTMECLQRKYSVTSIKADVPNFGDRNAKEEDDMAEPPEKRSNCELDDDEKKIQNSTKESFIKRTKEEKVAMKNKIFTDITISRPVLPIPGHTGYLTFASWYS
ncbi:tRNA (adenine(58)-N(1))-methyltransferase catalytic subunit TRMT61A-like isoform X2 [Xenia sp. Carnegie-2017]|uniref:tRNA (adenine(58)-N(1))-methyltransferase catalytic subunit TRMT61A-like isoform X2 n=1 Tax=Xenia sp. Carnegie-2017 TaxID=2897299 RepID=UPI001F04FEAB|nr:tRNA (adenine(58)-N(1))-methyltransferase catalytic subunit TRMT61A-like isoform X2 [Xenia sp. Carnegie-2017]